MRPTLDAVYSACDVIFRAGCKAKPGCLLTYAATYAAAVRKYGMEGEELRVQCLYIAENVKGRQPEDVATARRTIAAYSAR